MDPLSTEPDTLQEGGPRGIISRVTDKPSGFGSWLKSDQGRRIRYGLSDALGTMFAGMAGISPGGRDTSSLGRAAAHAAGAGGRASRRVEEENFRSFIDKKIALTDEGSDDRMRLEALKLNPSSALEVIAQQGWRGRKRFETDESIRLTEETTPYKVEAAGAASVAAQKGWKERATFQTDEEIRLFIASVPGKAQIAAARETARFKTDVDIHRAKMGLENAERLAYSNNLWDTLPLDKQRAILAGDHNALRSEIVSNREFEKMWRLLFIPGGRLEREIELKGRIEADLGESQPGTQSLGERMFGE